MEEKKRGVFLPVGLMLARERSYKRKKQTEGKGKRGDKKRRDGGKYQRWWVGMFGFWANLQVGLLENGQGLDVNEAELVSRVKGLAV